MPFILTHNEIVAALGSVNAVLAKPKYSDKVTPHLLLLRRKLVPLVQAMEDERHAIIKAHATATKEGNLAIGSDGGVVFADDDARGDNDAALRELGARTVEVPGKLVKIAYGDLPKNKDGEIIVEGIHIAALEFMISGMPDPEASDE